MSKKQLEIKQPKKLPMNIIQAEIYAYTPELREGVYTSSQSKYYELRTVQTDDGLREELVECDYPVTADYVRSFADMADYKKDVESNRNLPARGTNLGDITAMQDLANYDIDQIKQLQDKLNKALQEKQATQQETEVKEGEVNAE